MQNIKASSFKRIIELDLSPNPFKRHCTENRDEKEKDLFECIPITEYKKKYSPISVEKFISTIKFLKGDINRILNRTEYYEKHNSLYFPATTFRTYFEEENDTTALVEAIRENDFELVQMLVESGADVNVFISDDDENDDFIRKEHCSPLMNAAKIALKDGDTKVLIYLLEIGADFDYSICISNEDIICAIDHNSRFFFNGVEIKIETKNKENVLKLLLEHAYKRISKKVSYVNPNPFDVFGRTALNLATRLCILGLPYHNEIDKLIEMGANLNFHDWESLTPLKLALEAGNVILTEYFLIHGADPRQSFYSKEINIEEDCVENCTIMFVHYGNKNFDTKRRLMKLLFHYGLNLTELSYSDELLEYAIWNLEDVKPDKILNINDVKWIFYLLSIGLTFDVNALTQQTNLFEYVDPESWLAKTLQEYQGPTWAQQMLDRFEYFGNTEGSNFDRHEDLLTLFTSSKSEYFTHFKSNVSASHWIFNHIAGFLTNTNEA